MTVSAARASARDPSAERSSRAGLSWVTAGTWAVVAAWAGFALSQVASHDFRREPLAGDTASHLMQALSVSHGDHRLSFDEADLRRWRELEWAPEPVGMFFQEYDEGHFGVAKPYGYSVYLGPFFMVFGTGAGAAIGNAVLLALLMALSVLLLSTRYSGPVVPLSVGAFFLASYAYMYAYWIHTELFLALVVLVAFAAAARFAQTGRTPWAFVSIAAMAFGVSEKSAFIALFSPLAAVLLWKTKGLWARFALAAAAVLVLAISVVPYVHYSDGSSITPYGGEGRLYVESRTPFAAAERDGTGYLPATVSEEYLSGAAGAPVSDKILALAYTFVGRYTGLVVYIPVALLLLAAAAVRFRRGDAWGRAALLGVLAYVVTYAIFFPTNYFGGGQSLGNRYFLQAAPAVLAVVVLLRVPQRTLLACAVAGTALGVVLLWPQHRDPASAHVHIERTSPVQRALPFESNQDTVDYFECVRRVVNQISVCPP